MFCNSEQSSDTETKTHQSLHRVLRIVKPHSACSSPHSEIEEIENQNEENEEHRVERLAQGVRIPRCVPFPTEFETKNKFFGYFLENFLHLAKLF